MSELRLVHETMTTSSLHSFVGSGTRLPLYSTLFYTLFPFLVMLLTYPDQPQWSSVSVTTQLARSIHIACSFIILAFLNSNHIYIFLLFDFVAKKTFLWPEMQQKIWRYVVCSMSIVAAILVNDFATLQPVKVT